MIVKYSKKFPYAPYLNEDIGFEIEIPDDGDPLMELASLKEMAEKFHKDNNPQLVDGGTVEWKTEFQAPKPIPTKDISNESTTEDKIIEQIMQSSDLKVLDSFKLIAGKSSRLDAAFQERRNQLQSLQK